MTDRQQGFYLSASKHFKTCLEIQSQDSHECARTLYHLGKVNRLQRKYDEAYLNYERSLQIQKNNENEDSIEMAATLKELANTYREQGASDNSLIQTALQRYN